MYPYRRFAVALADADARLGAGVVRYSFAVGLSHSFQPAGFDRRTENLWASEQPSVVRLADEQAQLAKAVYTLTNPVAAGLVTQHHHWPGVISVLARMARPRVYKRPVGFFRENEPLPRHATLTIAPLPALAHASQDEYLATLRTAVVARETELARERQRTGRSVLGRRQGIRPAERIWKGVALSKQTNGRWG